MKIKRNLGSNIFDVFNYTLMIFLMIITFYPLYYVLVASFYDPEELIKTTGLLIYPKKFSLVCYEAVFKFNRFYTGYANTLYYLTVGTFINIMMTMFGGYALSRKNVVGIKTIMKLIIFTMFFSGGLIPTFLLVKGLGMFNTVWAVTIPGAVSTMNLIIMRTSFAGVPDSLPESAKMDGANDFTILFRIMIPLCMPTISVLLLFYSVGHWNSFFDAMIYINDQGKHPLQLVLRSLLISKSTDTMTAGMDAGDRINMAEVLKYAIIVVSTVPILCVYPFLQRYFTKGVMIGAIKG